MIAFALQLEEKNDSQHIAGLFGQSSGGDHGYKAFSHFGHKHGHGDFSGITHKGDDRRGLDTKSLLLRNISQDFVFNANSPWGMQQDGIFNQFINKAFDVLGISSTAQQAETMNTFADVAKENGFKAPVISDNASPEDIERAVIATNPMIFALNPETGTALKSSELAKSCEVSIPAEALSLCEGQGLPREAAVLMFVANRELNIELQPTMVARINAPAPSMMQ